MRAPSSVSSVVRRSLEDAVRPQQRPVATPWQHLAAQTRPFEVTADDWSHGAGPTWNRADALELTDGDLQRHQEPALHMPSIPPLPPPRRLSRRATIWT